MRSSLPIRHIAFMLFLFCCMFGIFQVAIVFRKCEKVVNVVQITVPVPSCKNVTATIPTPVYNQQKYLQPTKDLKSAATTHPHMILRNGFTISRARIELGVIDVSNLTDIIIGIPTVKRENADYLMGTLKQLVHNQDAGKAIVKIIVLVAATDRKYITERCKSIFSTFKDEVDAGILQVISPPAGYYPDWQSSLQVNFKDSLERVKWRSKQNLDQVLLMMHIYDIHPTYYLMVEDDIAASKGYVSKILSTARARKDEDWLYLSFCNLGAIGKLIRVQELPHLAAFIRMFWNKKPLDWLQMDYAATLYCSYDERRDRCTIRRGKKTPFIKPALFQHLGKLSSLKGKVQKLRDNTFRSNLQKQAKPKRNKYY